MSDLWERLRNNPDLNPDLRNEIEAEFGRKGKSALDAIDAGRVKQYLDFLVVEGRTSSYIVEDDFCTCGDFLYRHRACWHLLAVKIARVTGKIALIDRWYQESLRNDMP